MAPIKSVQNFFLGLNPILQSQLQADGAWDHFHGNHISDLTRFLQRDLRSMGYIAQLEQSLQIRRGETEQRSPESDVTVYDPAQRIPEAADVTGGLAMPVPQLLALDEIDLATYRAIGIYEKMPDASKGDAVAWVELLSPTNKAGGRHYNAYRDKREALLQAGLVFVELDYLHHQPPTVAVPTYPDDPDSTAFRILLIDPRPDWLLAEGRVYPVAVDTSLPMLTIPLNGGDALHFDLDMPYQQTYEALFFGDDIDYGHLPRAWMRYREDDQARILTRLLMIRNEGVTTPPRSISPLSLPDALKEWEQGP